MVYFLQISRSPVAFEKSGAILAKLLKVDFLQHVYIKVFKVNILKYSYSENTLAEYGAQHCYINHSMAVTGGTELIDWWFS
jgi:hypothetical protein